MPLDTTTGAPAETFVSVAKERWQEFFDAFTKVLEGSQAEIEVIGLALGDQIEAEWVTLEGLTYDHKDDTFYVYVEVLDSDLDHAISHPREILVQVAAGSLSQIVVIDAEGDQHIIRLKQPLQLPPA